MCYFFPVVYYMEYIYIHPYIHISHFLKNSNTALYTVVMSQLIQPLPYRWELGLICVLCAFLLLN